MQYAVLGWRRPERLMEYFRKIVSVSKSAALGNLLYAEGCIQKKLLGEFETELR